MAKLFFLFASINGAIVVILGAFGAHALKGKISAQLMAAFQTGTHYHMFHVLALMGLALLISRLTLEGGKVPSLFIAAGYCWMVGIVLFSGSLYGLALGGPSWLGPITPLGGSLLIIAWVCLSLGIIKSPLNHFL